MTKHFISSVINSGAVTVFTSIAMTVKNSGDPHFLLWAANWLISWFIVFNYVYWLAPKVGAWIHTHLK